MKTTRTQILIAATLVGVLAFTAAIARAADLSWNDGAAKKSVVEFVTKVTKPGSSDFVPVPERIATFDNDGTLWAEQPMYSQLIFALDRVKALAPQHPEWKDKEPFASLLQGDVKSALPGGTPGQAAATVGADASLEYRPSAPRPTPIPSIPSTPRPRPAMRRRDAINTRNPYELNRTRIHAACPRAVCRNHPVWRVPAMEMNPTNYVC